MNIQLAHRFGNISIYNEWKKHYKRNEIDYDIVPIKFIAKNDNGYMADDFTRTNDITKAKLYDDKLNTPEFEDNNGEWIVIQKITKTQYIFPKRIKCAHNNTVKYSLGSEPYVIFNAYTYLYVAEEEGVATYEEDVDYLINETKGIIRITEDIIEDLVYNDDIVISDEPILIRSDEPEQERYIFPKRIKGWVGSASYALDINDKDSEYTILYDDVYKYITDENGIATYKEATTGDIIKITKDMIEELVSNHDIKI